MQKSNLVAMNIVLETFAHKGRGLYENAPPEMHARVLAALLTGERHPDLSALPSELASKIQEHWAALSI